MKKKSWFLMSTLAVSLVLAACGGATDGGDNSSQSSKTEGSPASLFAQVVEHEGTAKEGGTLKVAVVAASPFKGILFDELSTDTVDSGVNYIDADMFGYDNNRKLDDSGLATVAFDLDKKEVTVKLTGTDYKWSDGQPFTIDDYIFTIHAVASKDYTGVRYDTGFTNIEGAEAYHNGEAEMISGVEKIDDYTVKLKVKEMFPSMQLAGGDIPQYVAPKHIMESIPVAEWESNEYVRSEKVVGMGPFKVQTIVPGESITYVANEYYYKGKPKLDSLVAEVVSPQTIVSEIKAGKYDIADMPSAQFDSFKDLNNVTYVGRQGSNYEYVAFKLGKYNAETGKNEYNPNSKMADKVLRQAVGYALDIDQVGQALYYGLLQNANSLIIPFFQAETDSSLAGYTYNPEKAKQLLDDAGYKDVDGDGLREDKNGQKLTINFAARTRDDANEALVQQYLTWWKEIGLDVQLYTGRTLEFNSFYEKIQADDPQIDMYAGGWSTGYDPNPVGLYGEEAKFNYTRYVNDEHTKLLNALSSVEAFDEATNVELFKKWQAFAFDEAFAIPTLTGQTLTAVNKRVKYYDTYLGSGSKAQIHLLEVTADVPVAAGN